MRIRPLRPASETDRNYRQLCARYGRLAHQKSGLSSGGPRLWPVDAPTRQAILAVVIVNRRWIAYFRAGQRSRAFGCIVRATSRGGTAGVRL